MFCSYELGHEKMCLMSYANNKDAAQPAHLRSLISAFVVRSLDSILGNAVTSQHGALLSDDIKALKTNR